MHAHKEKRVKMDWLGSALIVSELILVVFAITDNSGAPNRWRTPYIYVLLIVEGLILAAAFYVEGWVDKSLLIPFDLFRVPYLKALFVAFFSHMVV